MGKQPETQGQDGKGSPDGKQGEEQEGSTAKGKEGKKSTHGNNNAPGLASNNVEEVVEEDAMNWMELAAGAAIGIVVTALVIALVMRTKQKSAAIETETEMGTVVHVADASTSEATIEVTA